MSLIIPKLIVKNRQKSYAHLWKREMIWAYYEFLCRLEKQPIFEMSYEIDLIKPNGKISDKINGRCESPVRNYCNFIAQNMLGIPPVYYSMGAYSEGSLTLRDTAGTDTTYLAKWARYIDGYVDSPYANIEILGSWAGIMQALNVITSGILFEDSDTVYSFEQTTPVSIIANGTNANQLVYGDTWLPNFSFDAELKKATCIWERPALNNTAGQTNVVIKSVSLVGLIGQSNDTTVYPILLVRDVLAQAITVPYANQIKGKVTLIHER